MGLFEKKICSVCGGEIGLLGNRKLEDGNLCKNCAAKLSPWFSDRRHSTVAEIKQQLQYRQENEQKVSAFQPTKTLGGKTKVYVDETNQTFLVTRSTDFRKGNPDIIPLSQVLDVTLEIEEDCEERMTKDAEGKEVSYNPPQYDYEYTFKQKILLNNPWFDEISYEIIENDEAKEKNGELYLKYEHMGKMIQHCLKPDRYSLPPEPVAPIPLTPVTNNNTAVDGAWTCECGTTNTTPFCGGCGKPKPVRWFCPNCGKENNSKFCVGCGTPKPENA